MDSCCSGIISTLGGDYLRTPGAGFSEQAPEIRLAGVGYRLPGAPKAGYRAPKTESGHRKTRPSGLHPASWGSRTRTIALLPYCPIALLPYCLPYCLMERG